MAHEEADTLDQWWYDTSDYPKDHPLHTKANMKVIGKMKDELCGTPILEFISLRSKMHSIKSVDDARDIKKSKRHCWLCCQKRGQAHKVLKMFI